MITVIEGSWEPQQHHVHDPHVRDPNTEVLFYTLAKSYFYKKFRDLRTILSVCMCVCVCLCVRRCPVRVYKTRTEVISTFDEGGPSPFLEVVPD